MRRKIFTLCVIIVAAIGAAWLYIQLWQQPLIAKLYAHPNSSAQIIFENQNTSRALNSNASSSAAITTTTTAVRDEGGGDGGGGGALIKPIDAKTLEKIETGESAVVINNANNDAALENNRLENELAWTFGSRTQRGWHLYLPLICRTTGADLRRFRAADTDFPARLMLWQRSNGLSESGVLDLATWQEMIAKWQADRLKNRATPPLDQMLQAPINDFWDASRPPDQRFVERETYAAYKRMVRAAAADPTLNLQVDRDGNLTESRLKIVSAYRSPERQAELRRLSPNSGSAGLAVNNSPHFSGRALDLYIAGEPVTTRDDNRQLQTSTLVYQWLVGNAYRFGFRPYFYEPWHWEYVGETTVTQKAS